MVKTLIAIVGPTAIGKTTRAIGVAKHFNTEIVSTDSRQFYKEMQIGTAVPTEQELSAAKHHFIQNLSIFDSYSVGQFEREGVQKLKEIFIKKDIAVAVGGSGLYMDALTKGLDYFPKTEERIRNDLNQILEEKGIHVLKTKLKALDPVYYNIVDLDNPHRLIRALEICISSGKPYSSFLNKRSGKRDFKTLLLGINANREIIYERINKRVDAMVEAGLIEEAKKLYPHRELNALQTVGYRELFMYFEKKLSLPHAIEEIKKNTRRFAKRQLTWYRKNEDVIWLDYDLSEDDFINEVNNAINSIKND